MALVAVLFHKLAGVSTAGNLIFYYPTSRAPGRKGATAPTEQIELKEICLKRGLNFVESEVWSTIESHGTNRDRINLLKAQNDLRVYVPSSETPEGTTCDYTDMVALTDIINNTRDVNWLTRCMNRENRSNVFKMVSERLEAIQNERRSRTSEAFA